MAFAKCADCGRDVSTEAYVCPHCGWHMKVRPTPTAPTVEPGRAQPPRTADGRSRNKVKKGIDATSEVAFVLLFTGPFVLLGSALLVFFVLVRCG
jgi:DNA-directed RNA polymerase subunit RPC12/RpoP